MISYPKGNEDVLVIMEKGKGLLHISKGVIIVGGVLGQVKEVQ